MMIRLLRQLKYRYKMTVRETLLYPLFLCVISYSSAIYCAIVQVASLQVRLIKAVPMNRSTRFKGLFVIWIRRNESCWYTFAAVAFACDRNATGTVRLPLRARLLVVPGTCFATRRVCPGRGPLSALFPLVSSSRFPENMDRP